MKKPPSRKPKKPHRRRRGEPGFMPSAVESISTVSEDVEISAEALVISERARAILGAHDDHFPRATNTEADNSRRHRRLFDLHELTRPHLVDTFLGDPSAVLDQAGGLLQYVAEHPEVNSRYAREYHALVDLIIDFTKQGRIRISQLQFDSFEYFIETSHPQYQHYQSALQGIAERVLHKMPTVGTDGAAKHDEIRKHLEPLAQPATNASGLLNLAGVFSSLIALDRLEPVTSSD